MQNSVRVLAIIVIGLASAASSLVLPLSASAADDGTPVLPHDVAQHVAEDASLHVAQDGTVLARDEWRMPTKAAADSADIEGGAGEDAGDLVRAETLVSDASADALALHSRPGATRVIYLDFDGGALASNNTWRTEDGGLVGDRAQALVNSDGELVYPGWSLDSSAAFSTSERTMIREIWARVAEDFAPFDVDVTTQQPPLESMYRSSTGDARYGTRVAFSHGVVHDLLCDGSCGGVAWIGTYDHVTRGETRNPAWVFPTALSDKAKYMAEAASHEVGHNLGLHHDGTSTGSYYRGTSVWGPLMGSPYTSRVTQWSRGSYSDANNTEDDFARITSTGLPFRPDEAGQHVATAAALSTAGTAAGVVSSASDQDWYAIDECTGRLSATVTPAAVGPNLDLRLELRDYRGAVLATATGPTELGMTDMAAALSQDRTGGPYYLAVSGTGHAARAYDDYGSVGAYQLSMGGCSGVSASSRTFHQPTAEPPAAVRPGRPAAPRARAGARGGKATVQVRWSRPTSTGDAAVKRYWVFAHRLNAKGRVTSTKRKSVTAPRLAVDWRLRPGRYKFSVRAASKVGWSATSRKSQATGTR